MDYTSSYKRIVVKIGTNVITTDDGRLDTKIIKQISSQISILKEQGIEIILVSSGAVGAGKSQLENVELKSKEQGKAQLFAAVGQVHLINTYSKIFEKKDFHVAQVLSTKDDFRDREHYLNIQNCLKALLKDNVIPIVNENDVVSMSNKMFVDNDELAGLLATMMNADALIILTSVDGVFNKHPDEPGAKIFSVVDPTEIDIFEYLSEKKSSLGRGGMISKCTIASKLSSLGLATHIVNGKTKNNLIKAFSKEEIGTTFIPKQQVSNIKKWIAQTEGYEKGSIMVNEGLEQKLQSDSVVSILPIGITATNGEYQKGDVVQVLNSKNQEIGRGLAQYDIEELNKVLGEKNEKPFIHYNYLTLKYGK